MHRFFLAPEETAHDELVLSDSEAYHAATVLRLQPRQLVTVLNGAQS